MKTKLTGNYKSAETVEVITSHPLDPRVKWDSWDSLSDVDNWPKNAQNNPYLYAGLVVSVNDGTQNEQKWEVYVLNNIQGWNIPYGLDGSGWKKISEDYSIFWEDETV